MAEAPDVVRLASFPRDRVIERELFACQVSEVDLLAVLGPPTSESQPELGAGNPFFYWDLEWPCGLVTGLRFDQLAQRLTGYLDEPDVDHALRHLGLAPPDLWLLHRAAPDVYAELVGDSGPPHEIYRIGADGQRIVLASGLSRRDAHCRLADLEDPEFGPLYVRASVEGPIPRPPGLATTSAGTDTAPPAEPASAAGTEAQHLTRALVERAVRTLGRDEGRGGDPDEDLAGAHRARRGPTGQAERELPSSFDPGGDPVVLEPYPDEAFDEPLLLDVLADAAGAVDAGPAEASAPTGRVEDRPGGLPARRMRPSELIRRDLPRR